MVIVIALDSFKGSLTAVEACACVAAVFRELGPTNAVQIVPMADGGEGTADALVAAAGGTWVTVDDVVGPLPDQRLSVEFGWLPTSRVAVVEMARSSGLLLLAEDERNPLLTTTFGTGQILVQAQAQGAEEILLTLGGSATVDGGTGAARALGWQFLDSHGQSLPLGGGSLQCLHTLLAPDREMSCSVKALCDVDNPLCGPTGAATVYGPQKGATPEMVQVLELGLGRLAEVVRCERGIDMAEMPGAGAAGGFGAGAVAFLKARLVPGVDAVADAAGLEAALDGADWVVTGEGRLDEQSLQGKVVSGVLRRAERHGTRVAVLSGRLALSAECCRKAGIHWAAGCASPDMPDEEAFGRARDLLTAKARILAETIASRAT